MPDPGHTELPDLAMRQRVHVVGAGGAAMRAIAALLNEMGHEVSGSDAQPSPALDRLAAAGVRTAVGHDAGNLGEADVVFASTAIPPSNPELALARERGIPVLRRADALVLLAKTKRPVAVAGTHGKTTTSALLVHALRGAGLDPSFVVGGDIAGIGTGAAWGSGAWFVLEGDESDGTFLELGAEAAIVTSVEPDHLAHWGSFEALEDGFRRFLGAVPGPRLVCADDEGAGRLARSVGAETYGTDDQAGWRISDVEPGRMSIAFTVTAPSGDEIGRARLAVPGLHNARNATAALALAASLGADVDAALAGVASFGGVGRRFQARGEAGGVTFVDSYDHLPTEVAAAVSAARDGGWDRIVCVFQPHRYTRTAELWPTFAGAFDGVDHLVVTQLYTASEEPIPGISGELVAQAVRGAEPAFQVDYVAEREALVDHVSALLRPGDLCLTLGAGDLTTLPDDLLERLR